MKSFVTFMNALISIYFVRKRVDGEVNNASNDFKNINTPTLHNSHQKKSVENFRKNFFHKSVFTFPGK